MKIKTLLILVFLTNIAEAQLANRLVSMPNYDALDKLVSNNNSEVRYGKFSNDGRYFSYCITKPDASSLSLFVKSITGDWIKSIDGGRSCKFSSDSKFYCVTKADGNVSFAKVGENRLIDLNGASDFDFLDAGKEALLVYRLNSSKILHIRDLNRNKVVRFKDINSYTVLGSSKPILALSKNLDSGKTRIELLQFPYTKTSTIWEGLGVPTQYIVDKKNRIWFLVSDEGKHKNSIWLFDKLLSKSSLFFSHEDLKRKDAIISEILGFDSSSKNVLIKLRIDKPSQSLKSEDSAVKIFSNKSRYPGDNQIGKSSTTSAIMLIKDKMPIELGVDSSSVNTKFGDLYCFYKKSDVERHEALWNPSYDDRPLYLISINSGKRYDLPDWKNKGANGGIEISPTGNFLIRYDKAKRLVYGYDISNGRTIDICKNIVVNFTPPHTSQWSDFVDMNQLVIGWIKGTNSFLLQDNQNDIWKFDASGEGLPTNITKGFAKNNELSFKVCDVSVDKSDGVKLLNSNRLILFALDRHKNQGFYLFDINGITPPQKLSMSPNYYTNRELDVDLVKLKKSNIFLVQRSSCDEPLNYFVSKDLKQFEQISNLKFNEEYLVKTDLLSYMLPNGKSCQAVIYHSDKLDTNKKHPVIFSYYQEWTSDRFKYLKFDYSAGRINIPWCVARGYVVVSPDMLNLEGDPGKSAFNSIMKCTDELVKLPYIDSTRMGISGHSFGGFETNYIIAHTSRYKAAVSAAGVSDIAGWYAQGTTFFGGLNEKSFWKNSVQSFMERGQFRIGYSLWEKPDLYLDNSIIYQVPKIKTPLLIMHNFRDGSVPVTQGTGLYLSLRRLQKPVWLLMYDEPHILTKTINQKDFVYRLDSFFDYYLKDVTQPKWMKDGE